MKGAQGTGQRAEGKGGWVDCLLLLALCILRSAPVSRTAQ